MAREKVTALEPNKAKALAALLDSSTVTEAAEKAGVCRKTMYNYMREDSRFAEAYQALRDEQILRQAETISHERERARAIIVSIMEDETKPAIIRLKAAQSILKIADEKETQAGAIAKSNIASSTFTSLY